MDISELNKLGYEDFTTRVGSVVEHFPTLMAGLWSHRPFSSLQHLHTEMCAIMDALPFEVKEGILRVHPDLAGRLADSGGLTQESTHEQRSAGLLELSPQEKQHLHKHNQAYKLKFGFPFVICARQNKKEAILRGIVERYSRDQRDETLLAVNEVKKIAWYRLTDIVNSDTTGTTEYLANL